MQDFKELLRQKGYRATPGRITLLELLWREKEPLTVAEIKTRMGSKLDTVTLYRALEALFQKGIIRRVDLAHGHAHYELEQEHHHHLVCTDCGKLEDIEVREMEKAGENVLKTSKQFKSIYSHELEFFGLCNKCSK